MTKFIIEWVAPLIIISVALILVKNQGVGAKIAVMASFAIAYVVGATQNELKKIKKK